MASIRSQSYPHWELVLVNDGGPPVDDLVRCENDQRIRLINLSENKGIGYAMNRAFEASRGEFIAYLGDDDLWYPDHLKHLLLPLMAIPGIEMAYSDAWKVTLEEDGAGGFREVDREIPYDRQVAIADLLEYNHIVNVVVVHRRGLFSAAGGMDERLRVLLDWDLFRRVAAVTYPYHVSCATAEYFIRPVNTTTGDGQISSLAQTDPVRYIANRLRIIRKNLPLAKDSPLLPILAQLRRKWWYLYLMALGEKYEKMTKKGRARQYYLLAKRQIPDEISTLRKLGLLELEDRQPAKALSYFVSCLETGAREVGDYLYAALACLIMEKGKDALALLSALENANLKLDVRAQAIINDYRLRALQLKT